MHHDGDIGTAVTHVDDLVVADAKVGAKLFEHGDLSPSGGSANDGIDLAGSFVIAEARAEDVIRRNDVREGRLDDLLWRCGDDVEIELVAIGEIVQRTRKEHYVVLPADALADFYE